MKSTTPLPIRFWHRRSSRSWPAAAVGGLLGPYASAIASVVKLPAQAGGESSVQVEPGPARRILSLHLATCNADFRVALASSSVVHCAVARLAVLTISAAANSVKSDRRMVALLIFA